MGLILPEALSALNKYQQIITMLRFGLEIGYLCYVQIRYLNCRSVAQWEIPLQKYLWICIDDGMNKFLGSMIMLHWNNALWLAQSNHIQS